MRWFSVCFLFLLGTSLLSSINAESSSKWGILFNSFFDNGIPGIAVQSENPQDSIHARVKRAIYAAFGWGQNCNPGWTGTYCETPLCTTPNPVTSSNTMSNQLVDRGNLGNGCSQSVAFPVEKNVQTLTISIATPSGYPKITIVDQNNNIVIQNVGTLPTAAIAMLPTPAPGFYSLNVSVDDPQVFYCNFNIEVLSFLSVTAGFVPTPQDDSFDNGAIYNGESNYFIAHAVNVSSPGKLGALFIRINGTMTSTYTASLASRYGCGYEYFAGMYSCQSGSAENFWVVEGTDSFGFRFRRSKSFNCLNRPTPPTTPFITTAAPTSCLNGGTLVAANTSSAYCYCGEFFTGNDCAFPICMNGGSYLSTGKCDCQFGYSGTFCEHVTCSNDNIGNYFTEDKTLIVVLRQSTYIVQQIPSIQQIIAGEIQYYGVNDIQLYNNFILVTFVNDQISWMEYYSADDFYKNLNSTTAITNTRCNDTVVDAISKVFLATAINNKSPILVFTDVPADDGADYLTIVFYNTFRKLPIFIYYMADPSSTCNVDTLSPGYRTLNRLAHTSGGLVFTPTLSGFTNTLKYSTRHVTYKRQWVLGYDYFQCQMGNHGSFFVDSSTKAIAILATGTNLTIQVTDPAGNSSMVIDALVADNDDYIWHVVDVTHGAYLFFITSSGGSTMPCNYRVYIQSQYDLFYGISNSLLTDATFTEPILNQPSNIVAVLNGLRDRVSDQFRLFSEIQISRANNSGHLEPVYYSNGIYRDGCNFHLHFGAFACNVPGEHLYLTVYADDELGYPIQRTAVAYCAYEQPTEAPPGTCLHGGVPNPYNTTTCLCPTYWSGQYCQNLYCANNGTAINNLYCQCPPYTDGRYCDVVSCDSPSSTVDFGFTHRSLVFVLNVQNSMAPALTDLASQVQNLVISLITMHTRFITKFGVIMYDQTQTQILKVDDDPYRFIAAVQFAAEYAGTQPPATNCTGLLDQALVIGVAESLPNSYVFGFTDSESSQGLTSTDWIVAMENAQDMRTRIYLVATSNSLCGGVNGYQFNDHHIQMVEYTEGDVFYTTHPGKLLQFIPTLYKSGLFGGADLDNCSAEGYLPVDYWAQSFTIYTGGQNLQVTVTPPEGVEADYLNKIDTDTYLDIRQYIIPCKASSQWRPSGAYCYIYVLNASTWQNAHDQCHVDYEAHMIHIFNQETQDEINSKIGSTWIWIGLKRVGNSTTFNWDIPDDAPYTIPLSGYTNWEPSQNQSDPSTGDCVLLKPGTGGQPRWWTADCNTNTQTSMCQKHRYDQDFIPGRGENLLPAGLWLVKITGTGSCGFSANIQSEIQIFYGFTPNLHSDVPKSHADLARTDNRFIATVTGLDPINPNSNEDSIDGNLNYAYIYDERNLVSTTTFQRRTLCSYRTVSQTFTCPKYGSSSVLTQMPVQFSGIDQFGNLFERIGTPYCSVGVASCQHGGYLYNGQCICPPLFEGEACETRICMYGGQLMPNGECQCTEETTGESCQYFQCVPPRKVDFSDNGKTLVILLETSYGMGTPMFKIKKNLAAIVNNITTSAGAPQWFTNYILFPFDSTSNQAQWYPKTYATNIQTIVDAIQPSWYYTCPGGTCATGDQCPRPILQVINDTLNDSQFVSPNSVILLFTQSTVGDISKYDTVFANIQNARAQIQVILPDISTPCSLPWTDRSNRVLFAIPQMTGGNLFTVYSQDLVSKLLPLYLPSLYRNAVVDSLVVRNCTRDEVLISIDSRTPELTVVYSGVNPVLTLIDPSNNSVTLPPNAISSVFNYFGVVKTNGKGGTYRLIGTSESAAGTCLINIHADSKIELTVGFVQPNDAYNGLTIDDAHWVAVADPTKSNVIVIHTNNVTKVSIDYVQLYSASRPGRAQMFTSEVIRRSDDCSYQWVSVRGFYCDPFTTYELAVFGTDERSFVFRRSLAVHCVPDLPPRPPTPPTCDVSSRFYDIVVMIDGGASSDFTTLKNLMISTFSPYTLNANNTRLSVVVVNSNARVQNYLIDSDGKVPQVVINGATTDGSAGQNVLAGLQSVIGEYQNMNTTGYRPSARHLVVYASSNTNFTGGDPVDTLLSMKRSGMFGLVSVGYNLNADSAKALEDFSGPGCTYSDGGLNAAVNIANFIQDITCFRFPICGE